jgi:tetratricopeptide (TPR) repeat protein
MRPSISLGILVVTLLVAAACGDGQSQAERHSQSGLELVEQGRWQEAIAEYDKAIQLDANMASAYLNRGQAYNLLGLRQQAIADLDKAIELDHDLGLAYFYRGNAYEGLSDSQQAIADYRMALSLTSDPYLAAVIETRIESLAILEDMRGQ